MVVRSDLPKFGSNNRMSGTPEENKAIVQGSIAYFGTYSIDEAMTLAAFRQGMGDLGYVEGRTIRLDFRLSKGDLDALPALAAELVGIPVDVIVTDTSTAAVVASAATRTIPIVTAIMGGDPVALGLVKSYARPGGNLTGMRFHTDLSEKRLQLLKQAALVVIKRLIPSSTNIRQGFSLLSSG
jgi:ABC-type uncharacterized transport system substrate-binding protein